MTTWITGNVTGLVMDGLWYFDKNKILKHSKMLLFAHEKKKQSATKARFVFFFCKK
jgi:hypothetical protein